MKEAKAKPGMKAMMIPRTKNVRKAGNAARRAIAKMTANEAEKGKSKDSGLTTACV
jgi:hypothetical protein